MSQDEAALVIQKRKKVKHKTTDIDEFENKLKVFVSKMQNIFYWDGVF